MGDTNQCLLHVAGASKRVSERGRRGHSVNWTQSEANNKPRVARFAFGEAA